MSIQTNFDFHLDNFFDFLNFINNEYKIIPSPEIKVDEEKKTFSFLSNNLLSFYCSPIKQMFSDFKKEDYGVEVNYSISFSHYSDSTVNSSEHIIKFICLIISRYNSDCLLSHNGGEPLMIRKNGEYYMEEEAVFQRSMGDNAKNLIESIINIK